MRIGLDIDNVVTNFDKKILEEFYKEEKKKVILDTDMYNEIDDQFALTYLINNIWH